jgi:prepilin-type N-terminal cleavage/methylation domain-containing protein
MHPKRFAAKNAGFTLVEIMIVAAIIALLAAIAVPGFLRARKRTQAAKVLNDLRNIDSAIDQYALETNKTMGSTVAVADWTNYLKKNTTLYTTGQDVFGENYGPQTVDSFAHGPANGVRWVIRRGRCLFLVSFWSLEPLSLWT